MEFHSLIRLHPKRCHQRRITKSILLASVALISLRTLFLCSRNTSCIPGFRLLESATTSRSTLSLPTSSKHAFATFLAHDRQANHSLLDTDNYFTATRILAYQLLHAPETKSDLPLIVLVTPDVEEAKRTRLTKDGAIVWEAAPVDPGSVHTDINAWQDVLTKLRLWHLTQFERIVFLDADTILFQPIDDLFNDPAVATQATSPGEPEDGKLPMQYAFAGNKETEYSHHWPPVREHIDYPNIDYFNAGLLVLRPDKALFDYYASLTTVVDLFDPHLPEQNLLNYAHRRDGRMPWQQIDDKWTVHYATVEDIEGRVYSVHEKWWAPSHKEVAPYLMKWRWRMEGFFESHEGYER